MTDEAMMDQIRRYLEDNRQRFLDELCAWLAFPSVSAQRARDKDTLACAQWARDRLAQLGMEARLTDSSAQPVVYARLQGTGPGQVVIYGHYDVQPEDPLEQWQTRPFEPTIKNGQIYARGATDDKGQVFAHIMALEAVLKVKGRLPSTVLFLLEGQEESGGDHLSRFISDATEIRPLAVVVSDSSMYDHNTPALAYGLRGIAALELTVTAMERDVHSGTYGGAVANPAAVLARLLAQCLGPDGRITIPGIYDQVRELSDWERRNIAGLHYDDRLMMEELGALGPFGEPGYSTLERIWARPTFEINGMASGYAGQGTKTIIPAAATAKISLRLVPDQDPAKVLQQVKAYLEQICPDTVRLDVKTIHASPPVLFDTDHPAVRRAASALRAGFGTEPVFIRCGGSIPIVTQFAQSWGCPVLLMGFGQDSDGAHSPNEHFSIDSLFKGAASSAQLLLDI